MIKTKVAAASFALLVFIIAPTFAVRAASQAKTIRAQSAELIVSAGAQSTGSAQTHTSGCVL
ncbi:MAG: hypothetical protein J2P21_28040, partial [Chloracidobacterium sp.]|nr:hypothetical protein [Chloracidobacterium sp.]